MAARPLHILICPDSTGRRRAPRDRLDTRLPDTMSSERCRQLFLALLFGVILGLATAPMIRAAELPGQPSEPKRCSPGTATHGPQTALYSPALPPLDFTLLLDGHPEIP